MNNCGTGAEKVCRFVSTRSFDCAQDDKVFRLRPKRKLIRSVLINGIYLFVVWSRKAATASNAELDEKYKRLCRVVAKPAHKAQ